MSDKISTKIEITLIGDSNAVDTALKDIKTIISIVKKYKGIEYCQSFSEDF